MFEFLTSLCSGSKLSPLDAELRRQRHALKAIQKFVSSMHRCIKYWDRSGKSLRTGINGYFYDKPSYQRPVEDITAALDSLKTISASVKPQLELIKNANATAAESIARVEKASKRKKDAEKKLARKEKALKKLQQKAETGKDPMAGPKVKTAEDEVHVARNNLQTAETELLREMQFTMNGSAPEAAMQVARALETMIMFLVGSGADVSTIRAAIRMLQETHYISPLTAAGQQQQSLLHSMNSKRDIYSGGSPLAGDPVDLVKAASMTSRPASLTDPGSQQLTPRRPDSGASPRNSARDGRLSTSPTNPFTSE